VEVKFGLSLVGLREAIRSATLSKSCNEHVKRVYNQGDPVGSSGGICPQSTPKNSQNPLVNFCFYAPQP
jgi:hypothetical protein